ncbi:MAG TPA: hypothetical protein VFR63_10220 [Gaiellaceae bacterium]|nr:hypothetical protein [Gaiellaceae bacterium]
MDAAPREHTQGRGPSRLLQDFSRLERVTRCERPSARSRLEHELGDELAALLLAALVGPGRSQPCGPVA